MPVTIRIAGTSGRGVDLQSNEFPTEIQDLQEVLFHNPNLLKSRSDLELRSVCNPLALDSGSLDLFLVDPEGLPVAVEAKLRSNAQSHREVIGQILDYVSSLSRLNFETINKNTDGKLAEVALSFLPDTASEIRKKWLDEFRTKFDSNLRTHRIRGIIALDDAPLDLLKTFHYLNDPTPQDYRLVTVQRNRISTHDNNGSPVEYDVFSSSFPVLNDYIDPSKIRPFFKLVIQEFKEIKPAEMNAYEVYSKGKIENYRVKSQYLPDSIYYEFSDWKDSISIEIQVFKSEVPGIIEEVKKLEGSLMAHLKTGRYKWICGNENRFCRLMFYYSNNTSPHTIADNMCLLIEQTHEIFKKFCQL
ncbi:MAG: hypothetical protein WC379_17115 [Methanoregula sp.]|jgi:hypothetical protein